MRGRWRCRSDKSDTCLGCVTKHSLRADAADEQRGAGGRGALDQTASVDGPLSWLGHNTAQLDDGPLHLDSSQSRKIADIVIGQTRVRRIKSLHTAIRRTRHAVPAILGPRDSGGSSPPPLSQRFGPRAAGLLRIDAQLGRFGPTTVAGYKADKNASEQCRAGRTTA